MNTDTRYVYLQNTDGSPCGCVAYKCEGSSVQYAVATCHPNDKFSKVLAREVAAGRLLKTPMAADTVYYSDKGNIQTVKTVMNDIASFTATAPNGKEVFPSRAVRAARNFVK